MLGIRKLRSVWSLLLRKVKQFVSYFLYVLGKVCKPALYWVASCWACVVLDAVVSYYIMQ